jgi:hypothetical protein
MRKKNLYLDIETTTDHKTVRMTGVMTEAGVYYVFIDHSDFKDKFPPEEWRLITYNGCRFDLPVLKRNHLVDLSEYEHHDVYIMSLLLEHDRKAGHSLDSWGKEIITGYKSHKPDDPEWFYNNAPLSDLSDYCKRDLEVLREVAYFTSFKLKSKNFRHPAKIEQSVAEIVNRQVEKEVRFDFNKAQDTWVKIVSECDAIEQAIDPSLPEMALSDSKLHHPPKKQFKQDGTPSLHLLNYCQKYNAKVRDLAGWKVVKDCGIMLPLPLTQPLVTKEKITLSNQTKLKEWLMHEKGWKPTMWNYKKDSTGKKVRTSPRLTDSATKEPCPNLAKCGFTWGKELSEWLTLRARASILLSKDHKKGWLVEGANGFMPSDAATLGTPTGRFRHKGIVNVPRVTTKYGKEFRELFCAREGKVWVGWDASGLESAMEAHYVYPYDKDYAEALVEGDSSQGTDVHTRNMKNLGLPNRDVAKTFKYAITYGAQPPKLAQQLGVSQVVAQVWYDQFWAHNHGLLEFKKELEKEWRYYDEKRIVGLDGRLICTRSKHSLLNSKLQSAGAIVMKHAMIIADKMIHAKFGDDAYGLIRYHDEEQWECDPEIAEEVGKLGVLSITKAGEFLKLNVPLTGEYKIGNNWAETH